MDTNRLTGVQQGIAIKVCPTKLTDGSIVYDLLISDSGCEPLILSGCSYDDACALAQKMCDASKRDGHNARWFESDVVRSS